MRFAVDSDALEMAEALRDLLRTECPPSVVRSAWSGELEARVWAQLAAMGVTGATIDEPHGGLGLDELTTVALFEETGRAALPEPIVETVAVAAPLLRDVGAVGYLPQIADGSLVCAVRLASHLVVDLHRAALLLVRDGEDRLIVCEPHQWTAVEREAVDGGRRLFELTDYDRTSVAASGAHAVAAMDRAFDRGALATAAQSLGVARQLIDMTVEYAKARQQFGVPIGSFQAVKHHLSNALIAVEFARPMVLRAGYAMAHGEAAAPRDVSGAKAMAADAVSQAARVALQVHGAIGYTFEYDLHLWLKRAWFLAQQWGDASFHRTRVAAALSLP